jgi:hypothetical protein
MPYGEEVLQVKSGGAGQVTLDQLNGGEAGARREDDDFPYNAYEWRGVIANRPKLQRVRSVCRGSGV